MKMRKYDHLLLVICFATQTHITAYTVEAETARFTWPVQAFAYSSSAGSTMFLHE